MYVITLFLNDVAQSYGWTESYFTDQDTQVDAVNAMDALIPVRTNVLVDLCVLSAARVSDVAVLNDSQLSTNAPMTGALESTVLTAADPWSALNLRMEAGWTHRGRKYLHGVLEDTFNDNRSYNPANPNAAAWTAFFDHLVASYSLRSTIGGPEVYFALTQCIPIREVNKKVGRPFNLLRGRRPT